MSQPNPSELAVLKHFWSSGAQSAREVHDAIGTQQGWKPSTTRTVIARMEDKGWVTRQDVHGMAVFTAKLDRTATLGGLVRHLARQVLDMDGPIPAALFAESPHLSDAELDELDAIINAAEDEASDKKGGE
ncbi:MAG: BlaI/MecI/CopY family transcriptional regulator [Alphaproteobacteria bacterium]|nr:CopY family transcriptional regulator [Hyphomonas sp.]MBR9806373.1 BlaI/MecI/CopY family transcriptional regulator [Alphaproteobacteria bacterium]|tara:strand:+ start:2586 stop:2978 length:393 start_codon:yes stop_codon:yes gene_type:complete